jgi:hypothetical protein
MKRTSLPAACLAALSIALVCTAAAGWDRDDTLPTTSDVIRAYVDALGGRAAVENLSTRVCIGRFVHDLDWKSPPHEVIPFAAYAAVPDRVLMVEHKAEGTRCEGSAGEVTWIEDAAGVTLKDEPFRSKIAWLIDPQNALRLEEYFPDLEVTSEREIAGRWVYVLESSRLDPTHHAMYFDVETGLLVGIGYYWYLRDYREVDGVKLPHSVVMSRKGGSTTMVFDLIAHNLPLEQSLFAVPPSGPGSGR